jgi:hypothetical protein
MIKYLYSYLAYSYSNFAKISTLKQGVSHIVALPLTLKHISRQKNNYGNSNISPCKNILYNESKHSSLALVGKTKNAKKKR